MAAETVYTVDIKSEPGSDSEYEVNCRLCNKVFASCTALQNHARVAHIEAYETGDPKTWSEEVQTTPKKQSHKRQKLAIKLKTKELVSLMKPVDITSLASKNVSYIIYKSEDLTEEGNRKKTQKDKDEVKARKPELVKKPEVIAGPFECLELSTLGIDGVCHQMFFSCCEYSEHQLTDHMRPRRRAARCQVCERPLSQLHHAGPRDFTCEQCSEGFDTVAELLDHKNLFHSQKKRFECTICQKRFSAQGGVAQHMRMHTGDRPYKCPVCPKAFTQKSGLEQHIRTHTKVKPFRCVICSKTFIQTVHLRQHMRTHTNVSPFQCVICEKRFKQSSHLNYHLKNHPANMTDEQREKYREIVGKIYNTEKSETKSADDETYEVTETYDYLENGETQKVITCEVSHPFDS